MQRLAKFFYGVFAVKIGYGFGQMDEYVLQYPEPMDTVLLWSLALTAVGSLLLRYKYLPRTPLHKSTGTTLNNYIKILIIWIDDDNNHQ